METGSPSGKIRVALGYFLTVVTINLLMGADPHVEGTPSTLDRVTDTEAILEPTVRRLLGESTRIENRTTCSSKTAPPVHWFMDESGASSGRAPRTTSTAITNAMKALGANTQRLLKAVHRCIYLRARRHPARTVQGPGRRFESVATGGRRYRD